MRLGEEGAARATLLTIHGRRSWGLPGSAVKGIAPYRDDAHRESLDVLELLDGKLTQPLDSSRRVLELRVEGQPLSLVASGELTLLQPGAYELLPLPPELGRVAPLVTHVALIDGKPSLFVVSPERLLERDRTLRAARAAPPPDRDSSC